ncbi:MAG: hypothetical protein JRF02_01610, partial [Deltaproteobacteria bacterium]|nr:hypothetical protein [Deltaproteobacteria bacterium]
MGKNEMIINPSKEKGDPDLPPAGMLLLNPSEADSGMRMARKKGGKQYFLFNSRLMIIPAIKSGESFFVAGPTVGAP